MVVALDRLTVSALSHLAFPPAAQLVGGASGLPHRVEWVTCLRAAYPLFPDLTEGYLALASPGLGRRLDSRLTIAHLIEELARARAAGLLVDEPVSATDAHLADDLGLPLFVVPPDTDLRALERTVLRALVDRDSQRIRREAEARQRYEKLLATGGMRAVLRDVAQTAGAGVVVEDVDGVVVAAEGNAGPISDACTFPINAAGRPLGRLVLGRSAQHASTDLSLTGTGAAEACALALLQRAARQEAQDLQADDAVAELLRAGQDETLTRSRLERLGYAVSDGRRLVALAVSGDGPLAPPQLGAALARELRTLGVKSDVSALAASYGDVGLVLVSCLGSTGLDQLRTWIGAAARRLANTAACVGAGRPAANLAGLSESVAQALAALNLGRRLGGPARAHHYEDLGIERLLAGLRDQAELRRFYDETVGLLAAYDRSHGTELVSTLDAFFAHNANASQAARVLAVHRNTLDYRLQRISEITGLDLGDADARLTLQLALKLHRIAP